VHCRTGHAVAGPLVQCMGRGGCSVVIVAGILRRSMNAIIYCVSGGNYCGFIPSDLGVITLKVITPRSDKPATSSYKVLEFPSFFRLLLVPAWSILLQGYYSKVPDCLYVSYQMQPCDL